MITSPVAILVTTVVIGTLLIFFIIRPRKESTSNRYRKRLPKNNEPLQNLDDHPLREDIQYAQKFAAAYVTAKEAQEAQAAGNELAADDIDDADAILGIKPKAKAPAAERRAAAEPKAAPQPVAPPNNGLIMFYLTAPKGQSYLGYELLQSLLSCGLRYGEMNIFHRHEQRTGRGAILFSLAAATQAGTFDLSTMGGFTTRGLVMYMKVDKLKDPQRAFELMVETAFQLVEELGGAVLDANQQRLTKESITQLNQDIRAYAAAHRTPDLFELDA